MEAKICRWGNSLAVRIPIGIARSAKLKEGSDLEIAEADGCIVLRPLNKTGYDLDALLSQITEDNIHEEIESSGPVGREEW